MSNLQQALEYAHQHRDRFLEDLVEVLKIPSISTDFVYNKEVRRAAEWMADHMRTDEGLARDRDAREFREPSRRGRVLFPPRV